MDIGLDFTHDLGHSGIGTYSRSLTEAMIRIEPENLYTILTLQNQIPEVRKHFPNQSKLVYSGLFQNPMLLGGSFKKLIRNRHKKIWIKQAQKHDIVHFTHQDYFVHGIPNAAVTIHDIIKLYNKTFTITDKTSPRFLHTEDMINNACQIFVPSNFVHNELLHYFPCCKNKIIITYEGVKSIYRELAVDQNLLVKYGLNPNSNFFLYVGRLETRKNLDNIMLAYSYLPDNLKKDIKIVLICPSEKKGTAKLKEKIADLGLSNNILHLTNVSDNDLVHFYNAALALLFVSFSEGFGLPLIEAMNCGCPAVIANSSSLPEISDGSSILVDPADTESIRDGMIQISENRQLRQALSEKSLVRAKHFSWNTTAYETLKGYNKIYS
jgi:alpha-1,3-rhamnosyl/mannosyltransferase